jgi:hypothetical protein
VARAAINERLNGLVEIGAPEHEAIEAARHILMSSPASRWRSVYTSLT